MIRLEVPADLTFAALRRLLIKNGFQLNSIFPNYLVPVHGTILRMELGPLGTPVYIQERCFDNKA